MQKHTSRKHKRDNAGRHKTSEALELAVLISAVRKGAARRPDLLPLASKADVAAPLPPNPSAPRFTREMTPIYSHPFIGCKTVTIQLTATDMSWNGSLFSLLGAITSGASDANRTGDVIRVIGYELRARVHIGTIASPGADCEFQFHVIESPIPGLAITSFFADVGTAYSGFSPPDWDFVPATKRLYSAQGVVDTYRPSAYFHSARKTDFLVNYEQNSATLSVGQLYVAGISGEDPAVANSSPRFIGEIMVLYQDV